MRDDGPRRRYATVTRRAASYEELRVNAVFGRMGLVRSQPRFLLVRILIAAAYSTTNRGTMRIGLDMLKKFGEVAMTVRWTSSNCLGVPFPLIRTV